MCELLCALYAFSFFFNCTDVQSLKIMAAIVTPSGFITLQRDSLMDSRTNGLCRGGLLTDKAIFHQQPRVYMCQIFTTGGRQGNVNSIEALAIGFRTSNKFQTLGNKYFKICLFCLILRATQI